MTHIGEKVSYASESLPAARMLCRPRCDILCRPRKNVLGRPRHNHLGRPWHNIQAVGYGPEA